jgi:hypothetical protein
MLVKIKIIELTRDLWDQETFTNCHWCGRSPSVESPDDVRGVTVRLNESQGHKLWGRRQYDSFLISYSLNEGGING